MKGYVLRSKLNPLMYYGDGEHHHDLTYDINKATVIRNVSKFKNGVDRRSKYLLCKYDCDLSTLGGGRIDEHFEFVKRGDQIV